MMKYELQPCVLLEKVAGQNLLIAFGEKRENLPYIQAVNESAAFFWTLLRNKMEWDDIIAFSMEEFDEPKEVIEAGLRVFMQQLEALGYLTVEEI